MYSLSHKLWAWLWPRRVSRTGRWYSKTQRLERPGRRHASRRKPGEPRLRRGDPIRRMPGGRRTTMKISFELLCPQTSQEDLEAGALVLRVVLEALALEVLHQVGTAVLPVRLHKRLGNGQPKLLHIAPLRPEGDYGSPAHRVIVAQRMPGLREPLLPATGV